MPETGGSAPEPRSAAQPSPQRPAGRTILVVDDEPAMRHSIAELLRSRGHEVIVAGSGREALRAVYDRSATPALLLSDISMPEMSGIELAARLGAERPGIRIVLMTGMPESAELARGRPELVSAVLLKPFSYDDLAAVVDAVLAADPPGP
jgi:CheY-like chemotaxis protein